MEKQMKEWEEEEEEETMEFYKMKDNGIQGRKKGEREKEKGP